MELVTNAPLPLFPFFLPKGARRWASIPCSRVNQLSLAAACCDKDGTMRGCTKGYHVAVRKNHFKRFQMHPPHESDSSMSRVFEGRILKANEFVNESLSPARSVRTWDRSGDDSSEANQPCSELSARGSESDLGQDVNAT